MAKTDANGLSAGSRIRICVVAVKMSTEYSNPFGDGRCIREIFGKKQALHRIAIEPE